MRQGPGLFRPPLQLGETAFFLLTAQMAVTLIPFRFIALSLGEKTKESPHDISMEEAETAMEVRRLVVRVSRKIPWKPTCLVRALSAYWMLRRRGLEGTLYLGLSREGSGRMRAHSWLRCGSVFVVGGKERGGFAEVVTFARRG